jgi:hypothetical protein
MLLAALLAGIAAGSAPDVIQYRIPEALVVDKAGKPLFRAPRDFLLTIAGNPEGRVIAYDAERRMVRVSEHNPWWIPCDQLQPLATACQPAAAPKPKTRGLKLPPQSSVPDADAATVPDGRGVPSCPGDPRCPSGN